MQGHGSTERSFKIQTSTNVDKPMYRSRSLQPDPSRRRQLFVASGLAFAVILALLPPELADLTRGPVTAILAPAQRGLAAARRAGHQASALVRARFEDVEEAARHQFEHQRLAQENQRLRAELQTACDQVRLLTQHDLQNPPLLAGRCIPARILGAPAQTYLVRYHLLDAGKARGVETGSTVLQPSISLIDRGQRVGIEGGNVALVGSRVWGKVVSTDAHTSTVCPVTEPGFRDLVRLATTTADGRTLRFGAKGILEGTGEPLARLRMVETTEPVAQGDQVYSMAGQGFVDVPLLCGRVVRVERPPGAGHWDIWVAPATDQTPEDLAILCPTTQAIEVAQRQADIQDISHPE